MTPGVVVLVINNTILAYIDDGAIVNTRGDVAVVAHSSGDVFTVAITGSGSGTVALAGSIAFVDLTDTTMAYIGDTAASDSAGTVVNAGGNVLVDATDDTVAYLITGAISIGFGGGGIGASVSVAMLNKTTDAFIGSHATVNALGNSNLDDPNGLSDILDGNDTSSGFETVSGFHGLAVQASTSENVSNFAAAGAGGTFVGLAGGVSVELFSSDTQAFIGNSAYQRELDRGELGPVCQCIRGQPGIRLLVRRRAGYRCRGHRRRRRCRPHEKLDRGLYR